MTPRENVAPEAADAIRQGVEVSEARELSERLRHVEQRLALLESSLDIIAGHIQALAQGAPLTPPTTNGDGKA